MLSEPFQENQVDMKIMYYELIRMLIDYERKNHPESFDATKSVGKIEGYQELTNKLQRYLNQRFIEDIDDLGNKQASITNINISQKFEHLEKSFQHLEQNFTRLEETNITLVQKNTALEERFSVLEKTNTELSNSVETFQESFNVLQQNLLTSSQNNQGLMERLSHLEKQEQEFKQEIRDINLLNETLEGKQKAFEDQQILNSQVVEEQLSSHTQISRSLQERIEKQEQETGQLTLNEKHQNERLTALEKTELEIEQQIQDFDWNMVSKKITNLEESDRESQKQIRILESTNTQIQDTNDSFTQRTSHMEKEMSQMNLNLEQMEKVIDKNNIAINNSNITTNRENIEKLYDSNKSIITEFSNNTVKANDNWETVNGLMTKHTEAINSINSLIMVDKDNIEKLGNGMNELSISINKIYPEVGKTFEHIEKVQKNVHILEKIVEDTKEFISKDSQIIKEIIGKVSNQENRIEEIVTKIDSSKESVTKIIERVESITKTIQIFEEKHTKTIERVREMTILTKSIDNDMKSVMTDQKSDNEERFLSLEQGSKDYQGKLTMLEDAYQVQQEKAKYVERLGDQLNHMDEMGQQSEAKAKDEVDSSMARSSKLMESLQSDFDSALTEIENTFKRAMQNQEIRSNSIENDIKAIKMQKEHMMEDIQKNNKQTIEKVSEVSNLSNQLFEQLEHQIQESTFIHAE